MESPASGADSSSDSTSRLSSPTRAHEARNHRASSAACSLEGSLVKWWTEVRGSDRQPWDLPSGPRARQPQTPTACGPAAFRPAGQHRASKGGKRGGRVTLVSPPASRSCGPFMCHGLHNSYLIDERSAGIKDNPSAARLAAEKKKASAPKPFLVGGRGASTGPAGVTSRRHIPWRTLRFKAAKDGFQFPLEASEEEARRYYRDGQLKQRLAAIQNRKLRQQQASARSAGATGAVGSSDALKTGDSLRVTNKQSDASEGEQPADDDRGLSGAIVVTSTDQTQGDSPQDRAQPSIPKQAETQLLKHARSAKWHKNSLTKRPSQSRIQFTSKKSGSYALATTTLSVGGRREPHRKHSKQKSRSAIKVPSRTVLLKAGRKQMQRKRCQTVEVSSAGRGAPVSLCVQVKSCVEGTRTDALNMFGSPAAAHTRGVVDASRGQNVHAPRRRSESQLVSAAASEAAKWLANRARSHRQAAGLPVVQLLLPSAGDLRQPSGDSRAAHPPVARCCKVTMAVGAAQLGTSAAPNPASTVRPSPSQLNAKAPKKWTSTARRREVAPVDQAGTSMLRRYFGAPSSRLNMDEIGQDFNMDWSEVFQASKDKAKSMRTGYENYKTLDMDSFSEVSNDYLVLDHTELDRNANIPSKLRMLGNMPKNLFGRNEKGPVDQESTMMRMGFAPKQKACMETQVTPRIKEVHSPSVGSRRPPPTRGRATEPVDAKRSVDASAGATVSVENAIPLAFRREGSNQAFKAVLDMVLQNAQGRSSAGGADGGGSGGGGGDTRKGGGFGGRQGGGDFSMFRNFFNQALKAEDIPTSPSGRNFGFDNGTQSSSYRAIPKNVLDFRNSPPKPAEEVQRTINPSRLIAGMGKQRTVKQLGHFTDNSNLEGSINFSPRSGGSLGGKMFSEMKTSPRVPGLVADGSGEFVSTHNSQPPAIARSRPINSTNLGDLMATLRRAEKLP